ncbi:peptidoglycan-binding protein [uncultured Thiodictyon sp.]|uniref:peptidoglycan-binding protein n=1 Tax=uncultured Thiodictyon sp. TaxID=1846217 RepID=UPI0025E5D98A|nr:peptidoglycan-binding protein [uncultured Thiodictyon sp.]
MRQQKSGFAFARSALTGLSLLLIGAPALAQPARVALVIGDSNYIVLPALPACLESSQALAKGLRGLGFQVVERADVTSGGMAAAIDAFGRGMAAAPGASVFVYVCGYGAGMNDRPFLLPASARIQRPSDVMTQGLLVKALLDVLVRGQPSRGVLALDLVPAAGVPEPVLSQLAELPIPEGVGLVAVTTPPPATGPTPLAAALTAGLTNPQVQTADLLAGLEATLGGSPRIAMLRLPASSRRLAEDEAVAAPSAVPTATPTPTPTAATPTVPAVALPPEGEMTQSERRRVQVALAEIGYYSGRIDGEFGPESRAAIRRFQHEIGAELTGVLTGEQAGRLLNGPSR